MAPPAWELHGRTQKGGITLLVGARGTHKSRAQAAMLGASVTGTACYGAKATRRGPVLAVIAEDLPGWRQRWFAWRTAEGIAGALDLHTWAEPVNLWTGDGFGDLLAEVQRIDPIVIGIDTFSDVIEGADENSQGQMSIVRGRLKQLKAGGCSLVVVHHTGHDTSRERGSSVLGAMADTILLMKEENGEFVMENKKQRNGPPCPPLRLGFDPKALVMYEALPQVGKPSSQQSVVLDALRVLAKATPGGVPVRAWRSRCCQVEGVPPRTFYDAKNKLVAAGRVVEPNGDGKFIAV